MDYSVCSSRVDHRLCFHKLLDYETSHSPMPVNAIRILSSGIVNDPTQHAVGQTIGVTTDWLGNTIQNFGTSSH